MFSFQLPIDDISEQIAYDSATIKKAFRYITEKAQIEFDFLQGGCQQRSHLISMILKKKFKIEHNKVWLFAPAAMYDYDHRAMYIDDVNNLTNDKKIYWNYHTAPVIKYKTKNEQFLVIIDPSINKKEPITIDDWLKSIGNSEISKYTFLKPEKYFFNCKYNDYSQLTTIIDGTFIEYENPAKDNLILEKGLAVNDMVMTIYKKYIKHLIDNIDPETELRKNDLIEIFGNALSLELLFIQNNSGSTQNTSIRYLLTHYSDIANEASKLFHKRLLYWTKFTNKLMD